MKHLISFFFAFIIYVFLFSQEPGFKLYTTNDGLVGNQVWGITQDKKGFLWIATTLGVSRFDGLKFKNFTKNNGLTNSLILDIATTGDSVFVLGKNIIDIIINDTVTKYYTGHNIRNIKFIKINRQLFVYCENVINNKYLIFNVTEKKFEHNFERIINYNENYDVYSNNTESFKLIGNNFFKLDLKKPFYLPLINIPQEIINIKNAFISDSGNTYIITKKSKSNYSQADKLIVIDNKGIIKKKYDLLSLNISNSFSAILPINNNLLVIIDLRGNIYVINNEELFKINYNFFTCVKTFTDSQDNIWICTDRGLVKLFGKEFFNFPANSNFPEYVWGIFPENNNKIWFTSYSSGLHCYKNGKLVKRITKIDNIVLFPYYGITKGFNDDIYIPDAHGVIVFNIKTQTFKLIKFRLNNPVIFTSADNINKKILFGSGTDLFEINQDHSIDSVCSLKNFGSGLSILAATKKDNNYYLACSGNLFEFNNLTKKGKWFNFNNIRFNSIEIDYNNNIWAASDEGIYFISAHDTLCFYNKNNFLALKIDTNNILYAVNFEGLYRLNLNHFINLNNPDFNFFGKDEGFNGAGDQNAFYLDYENNLWLPGSDHSVKIITSQLKLNTNILNVFIEDVNANDNTNTFQLTNSSKQILKYNYKNINFNFLAICLSAPSSVKYRYRLIGYDDKWSIPSDKREARYTNLPPGDYVFEVMASTDEDFKNFKTAEFSIKIKPPLWGTMFFKITTILFFFALVIFIFRLQTKKIKKQASLKQKMSQLEMELLGMQIEPHFVGNSLEVIKNFIRNKKIDMAINAINDFGSLLRTVAIITRKHSISLEEELNLIDLYIKFQKLRFKDSIILDIKVDEQINIKDIFVPPLIIQPFVENSIKHGFKNKDKDGIIEINIKKFNTNYILISIFDNGSGRINETLINEKKYQSIGITNSEERLRIFNDTNEKVIEIYDKPDGVEVVLWINIKK